MNWKDILKIDEEIEKGWSFLLKVDEEFERAWGRKEPPVQLELNNIKFSNQEALDLYKKFKEEFPNLTHSLQSQEGNHTTGSIEEAIDILHRKKTAPQQQKTVPQQQKTVPQPRQPRERDWRHGFGNQR